LRGTLCLLCPGWFESSTVRGVLSPWWVVLTVAGILAGMGGGDVLAGVEEIGWAGLTHAYGAAGDVPGLLRALVSASPQDRERAMYKLYGTIFHQGSRYEATAYAVPFLARLAADPGTPQRDEIVRLLADVAIGYDERFLPAGIDVAGWRARIERMRAADPAQQRRELDVWVEAARDERERRARSMRRDRYDPGRELRSAQDELDAYDAVRAELPGLRGLLGDGDPRVRAAAAFLVGWFPQEAAASCAALRALLVAEAVPEVTASVIVSAGLLGDTGLLPRLREYLSGSGPLLCWAAAIALARLGDVDPAVIEVLAAASMNPPLPGPGPAVSFLDGDLRGYAAQTLATLTDELPPDALDAVLAGLAHTSGAAALPMASAALRLAFPGGAPHPLPPFGELTGPQRHVVRTLVGLGPESWISVDLRLMMQNWNLPSEYAECRTYAGL
jgi:hypothetical protein